MNPSQPSVLACVVSSAAKVGEVRRPCTTIYHDILRGVYPVSVPRVPQSEWQIHDIRRPWSNVQAIATALVGRVGERGIRGVWACQGWRIRAFRPTSAPSGHAFLSLTTPGSAGFVLDGTEDRALGFRLVDEDWWEQFGAAQSRDEHGAPIGLGYAQLWRPRGTDAESDGLF